MTDIFIAELFIVVEMTNKQTKYPSVEKWLNKLFWHMPKQWNNIYYFKKNTQGKSIRTNKGTCSRSIHRWKKQAEGIPWCPGVKTLIFHCRGAGIDSLVEKLTACRPWRAAKGNKNNRLRKLCVLWFHQWLIEKEVEREGEEGMEERGEAGRKVWGTCKYGDGRVDGGWWMGGRTDGWTDGGDG